MALQLLCWFCADMIARSHLLLRGCTRVASNRRGLSFRAASEPGQELIKRVGIAAGAGAVVGALYLMARSSAQPAEIVVKTPAAPEAVPGASASSIYAPR